MIPGIGGSVTGGAGGIDLSAGPATSGDAKGSSGGGGAVFNFAPPTSVQQTQSITKMVALVAVAGLILWLMNRK